MLHACCAAAWQQEAAPCSSNQPCAARQLVGYSRRGRLSQAAQRRPHKNGCCLGHLGSM